MATNGALKTTVVLLSLVMPIVAHTDHYPRPTPKMRSRQHASDLIPRNRYSDSSSQPNDSTNLDLRSRNTEPEYRRELGHDGPIVYPDAEPKSNCTYGVCTNVRGYPNDHNEPNDYTDAEPESNCTYGLCTNVRGYPTDRIKQLLDRSQLFKTYFEAREDVVDINNRFSSDETFLCETMTHTIYPEKAENVNKVEKIIVNVEGHKQGIVFETCVDNKECKFSTSFPNGYTSYCKQKYIHKRLMVLGENDKFVFDSFEVPSCCVCVVKKTD